tara:strand:- start:14204 stop:16429 length:2226 start_codon:yes stop_codon:yes gene_type:complete
MSDCEHELLNGLTDAQVDAVTTTEGPLLVLAGPGSGKTTVVTRRIAWLLAQGIPSWQLLALTFTNKAAGEMRDRVDALLPGVSGERRGLTIMTFHGFCARLLRQYPDEARVPSNYSIYDTTDRRAALKQAVRNAGLDSGNWTPASVGEAISQCKNRLTTAEQHDAGGGDFYTRSIGRIYREYQTILDRNGALDFDDLLLKVAVMLRDDDEMRQTLQDRFRYLMIDEYQDTNQAQFVIASALVGPQRNICVVGDPDQSIYGWRGADISNILDFEHQFSAAKVVSLGRNFRSTGHIVEASAGLIRRNSSHRERTLHTELGDGDRVVVAGAADEHDEARQLVDLFRDQFMAGTPWREMAVLYRINALSRVLEQAFRDGQIPYVVARGTAFYERAEIKDALSYLRLVVNPRDEVALRRIINTPPRGIGKTSLDRVEKHAILNRMGLGEAIRNAEQVPALTARARSALGRFDEMVEAWRSDADGGSLLLDLPDFVSRVIRESGLEKSLRTGASEEDIARLENLDELVTAAAEWTPPRGDPEDDEPTILQQVAAWLESIALVSDADMVDPENGSVTLMSLHAAKGLEFDVVAMAGFEQGLLPHARSLEDDVEREEERRLCYVGMTRARRTLHLSHAHRRTVRGITERTMPSQFLGEIPADALDRQDDDDPWGTGIKPVSTADWQVGATVRHPTFGLGMIRRVVPRPRGTTATIEFLEYGHRTLLVAQSNLELVDPDERPWEGIDIPI